MSNAQPIQTPLTQACDHPEHNNDVYQHRCDLAAVFRWTAKLNMHEAVANHFSFVLPGSDHQFLVNPKGRHFSRIQARELLLLDATDCTTMQRPDAPDPTAWAIHSAIHRHNPRARCVLHVHSKYATILASLANSELPPIDQNTMRFYQRISIDQGFAGMGLADEAERLSQCLGENSILLLGNHGVIAAATTIAQAFDDLYYFERACETYICALMTNHPLRIASHEVAEKTAQQWANYGDGFALAYLSEIRAILDQQQPDYKN